MNELKSLDSRFGGKYESLCDVRYLYEPYVVALGEGLLMDLPEWKHKVSEPQLADLGMGWRPAQRSRRLAPTA